MINIDHVIADLINADQDMSIPEIYDHCVRIGRFNGLTENQVREKFTVNEQLKRRNGN